jgi:hypothetical protein
LSNQVHRGTLPRIDRSVAEREACEADRSINPISRFTLGHAAGTNSGLSSYYRCLEEYDQFDLVGMVPSDCGYFRFGQGSVCYGSYHRQQSSLHDIEALPDAIAETAVENGRVCLPFNPAQVISNLQHEVYADQSRSGMNAAIANLYYWLRPALPVAIRQHLQKFRLRNWDKLSFPHWPVDCSVDNLVENLMLLSLRASGSESIPFIWFWPQGYSACAVMTHDVETQKGLDFCPTLMDIDESFGIRASFQIIPEERYSAGPDILEQIRNRGFEVCVHDLNHDGHLYKSREQFFERADKINDYGKKMGAEGFRSAVLYRRQDWYHALNFSYDMSVPNVAHLDPQRGGCCTVMPYFLNGTLEIPVTTIQDYSLFNILHDYSISIWRQQTEIILAKHGMMSFIVHPDYVTTPREQGVFKELLGHLAQLREKKGVWITTPGEINRWWRQRADMQLVKGKRGWRIEGPGSERASVAYASEKDGRLVLSL